MEIEKDEIDEAIIALLQWRYKKMRLRGTRRGVLPRHVFPWLDIELEIDNYRCEATIRRRMKKMAEHGLLIRVGGERGRRGYVFNPYRMSFPRQLELPGF